MCIRDRSYVGLVVPVSLRANQTLNFGLLSKSALINEVVVYSKKRDGNVKNAQMGKIDLTMNQVRAIPAFMGEVDILKAIQLLPGVQSCLLYTSFMVNTVTIQGIHFMQSVTVFMQGFLIPCSFQFMT